MKKSRLLFLLLSWLMLGSMAIVSSCSDDDNGGSTPAPQANKATLTSVIDSVNTVYNAATEGTRPGNYAAGSKATLKTAIDLATTTKNDAAATQTSVNTAVANLRRAARTFNTSLIQEVSVANLVAQYKFTGNANDASANANNGTLKTGLVGPSTAPVDGGTLPVLVADRFGRANQAYEFSKGAYIEVPYKAALNPQEISLSVWCKRIDTNENNYMVSLNRWTGYKFQLQSANKPFFTANTTPGIFDKDAESGVVPLNVWTHVATTYVDGTLKFYINGALVKTWTDTKGALRAVPQPVALCIGQQLPKEVYNSKPTAAGLADNYFQYYGEAFFKGQLDDVRIYNKALSDAEVTSIYTIEKDQ